MLAISIDAPANTDLFETFNGLPITADRMTLGAKNDLLVFFSHFAVLLSQLLASGQCRAHSVAVSLCLEVVHVASAAAEAELLALVTFLVEAPS